MVTNNSNYEEQLDKYKKLLEQEMDAHKKTKIKLKSRERALHTITQSRSYKAALILARSRHLLRIAKSHAKELNISRQKMLQSNRRHVQEIYQSKEFKRGFAFDGQSTADLAVVIHLYYTEMLPYFLKKLKSISHLDYDLFITIPEHKSGAAEDIRSKLPNARVLITPNCGRDVLPFVEVMRNIKGLGYKKVLKLHSKKSPHRNDGSEWRDRIVDNLLPTNKSVIDQIIQSLEMKNAGIVGPKGEYVSFLVNFEATEGHVKRLVERIFTKKAARELNGIADEYGFFAGTMFWARLDALMTVIDHVSSRDFEPELGQEDSTLAHSLERLFCVIPELNERVMLESNQDGVKQINYHTANIPAWSEIALEG